MIATRVHQTVANELQRMADEERRTLSQMVAIILEDRVHQRTTPGARQGKGTGK